MTKSQNTTHSQVSDATVPSLKIPPVAKFQDPTQGSQDPTNARGAIQSAGHNKGPRQFPGSDAWPDLTTRPMPDPKTSPIAKPQRKTKTMFKSPRWWQQNCANHCSRHFFSQNLQYQSQNLFMVACFGISEF